MSGLTYDEVLSRLQAEPPKQPNQRRGRSATNERDGSPDLASLQEAVGAWRTLAEERARQVAELRQRLGELEALLEEERSKRQAAEVAHPATEALGDVPPAGKGHKVGWWARVFFWRPRPAGEPGR